jgi:hypothetical protein
VGTLRVDQGLERIGFGDDDRRLGDGQGCTGEGRQGYEKERGSHG